MERSKLIFALDKVLEISKASPEKLVSGSVVFIAQYNSDELHIYSGVNVTAQLNIAQIRSVFATEDILGKKQSLVISSSGGLCTVLPDGLVKLKETDE